MLDKEEKNAALSDKKKSVCGFKSVSEAENHKANTGLYTLADDEMKLYQYFSISKHQFN